VSLPRLHAVKTALGLMGLIVGLAGMAAQRRGLVYAAVVLLGAAVLLRLVERKRKEATD
jgi:hypothetical protein